MMGNNRTVLRDATRQVHERTEQLWFAQNAFASHAAYLRWLSAMATVHQSLAPAAVRALDDMTITQTERDRTAALAADLGTTPSPPMEPLLCTKAEAWGVMYVLNGSAMGASVLLKSQGLKPDWPQRYLQVMRSFAQSGALRQFFDLLDQVPLDHTAATAGAHLVFDALQNFKTKPI